MSLPNVNTQQHFLWKRCRFRVRSRSNVNEPLAGLIFTIFTSDELDYFFVSENPVGNMNIRSHFRGHIELSFSSAGLEVPETLPVADSGFPRRRGHEPLIWI